MAEGKTYQSEDGTTYCAIVMQAVAPAVNFARMKFGFMRTGGSVFSIVDGVLVSGSLWKARIDGLVPGMSYDFVAISENNGVAPYNQASSPPVTIIAAGDTTAPAVPTGLTGKGKLKTWSWTWAKNTENDLKRYRIQVASNSSFTTIIYGSDADKKYVGGESFDYTDDTRSYGSLYCRVQAVDFSGNASAWNAGAMATTAAAGSTDIATGGVQSGNIASGAVTTVNIGDSQVTTAKRQGVNSQSLTLTVPTGSYSVFNFSHASGITPLVTMVISGANRSIFAEVTGANSSMINVLVSNYDIVDRSITITVFYW